MAVASVLGKDGMTAALAADNETVNNYLDHRPKSIGALSEVQQYENAVAACSPSNPAACQLRDSRVAQSAQRDHQLAAACDGGDRTLCANLSREAIAMGNIVQGENGSFVYANSPQSGPIRWLDTGTIGASYRPAGFDTQIAPTMASAAVIVGAITLGPEALVSKSVAGAVLGGGFDAFGQLSNPKNEPYRGWQTVISAATGSVAFPLGGRSLLFDGALGAVTSTTNTAVTNAVYGRSESVQDAAFWGGAFGALGNGAGTFAERVSVSSGLVPRVIYPNGTNPQTSILFQWVKNPLPGYINTATSATVGGFPSLFPYWMPTSPPNGGKQP